MNIRETAPPITELEKISTRTDTRDYLAKAAPTTEKLKDWLVVDVDAHVNETAFWSEITDRIDNDVLRYIAESFRDRGGSPPGLLNANGPLYQDVAGRIMHQQKLAEPTPPGLHRQVQLTQRAMDAMGIDYMVVFPTPMLSLGMHPQVDAEVALGNAYNRWLIEQILPQDTRQKALLYLPFNDPDACVETRRAIRRRARRGRLLRHLDAAQAGLAQFLHAALRRAAGAGQAARLPRRLHLVRSVVRAAQPLHRHARAVVRALQHGPHDQLGAQRPARALPQAQGDLDRERARLGSVRDAAARFRIHDAHVGMPAAQAQAERVHAGDVLHEPAARAQQHEAHAGDLRGDQGRYPAALCVGLAALGFRRAELDHQAAVPQRAGQAQHSRAERRAAVRPRSAAGEIGQEGAARSRSPFRPSERAACRRAA